MIRVIFCLPLLVVLACSSPGPESGGVGKPNILFILTDDQGIGDLSLHGNDSIRTPNMDALLSGAAKFERFYVSPVCAPTRASFLSGMYHPRTGAVFVTRRRETMDDAVRTIPEYLKDAGYRTGLFGKWHNGATKPYDPAGQGFDEFLGFSLGHFNDYFNGELENERNEVVPFSGDLTGILTDTAAAFMLAESGAPFFCMLTYQAPHTPVQVADEYWNEVKTRGLTDYNTGIYAMIESIDDRIGQLLNRLDEAGKLENTIVVFSTDNGPNGDRYRMGLRGTKGHVDEGGVRVPFGIRFPGDHPANGRQFSLPAAHIDLLPTLLDAVSLPVPDGLDGRSLLPLLESADPGPALRDRSIYAFKQGYDYNGYPGSVRNDSVLVVLRSPTDYSIYNLEEDPGQERPLDISSAALPAYAVRGQEMVSAYNAFAPTLARPDLVAPPIDLDAATGPVHLQAHEGEPRGGTHFNDEYGWANDWFVDLDGEGASWPIETRVDAAYTAEVHYQLRGEGPQAIYLQADRTAEPLRTTLPPFSAPDLPVADRTKRKEVYPQRWAKVTVPELKIPAGSTELVIGSPDGEDLWIKEVTLLRK